MNETNDISKIVNRHMARLLSELNDAGCPVLFVDAVKSKLVWLRSDLQKAQEDTRNVNKANEHGVANRA